MNKENCTKGPVYAFKHEIRKDNELGDTIAKAVPHPAFGDDEREANAELIAEAFNVLHETGYTPRELVSMLAKMNDALKVSNEWMESALADEPEDFDSTELEAAIEANTSVLSKYQPVTPA